MSSKCFELKEIRVAIIQMGIAHWRESFFTTIMQDSHPDSFVIAGRKINDNPLALSRKDEAYKVLDVRNHHFRLLGFSIRYQAGVLKYIRRKKPDVVIIEGTAGIISNWLVVFQCRVRGISSILWVCDWDEPKATKIHHSLRKIIFDLYLRTVSGIFCYSKSGVEAFAKVRRSTENIFLVQNTIDIESIIAQREEYFHQARIIRKKMNIENRLVILYVGGLLPRKKVDDLIQAFKAVNRRFPNTVLVIVGDGTERKRLELEAGKKSAVIFLGHKTDDVGSYFSMADLFVMPGTGGLAVNEAMAHGKPIISTKGDRTILDLVEENVNGFIIEEGDIASIAEKIMFFCTNREKIKQFGEASLRLIIEKASLQSFINSFENGIMKIYANEGKPQT